MLFRPRVLRLLPRYRRLMRTGTVAQAVVLQSREWGWVAGVVRPNYRLTLRVHYADGTGATIERVERIQNLGALSDVGSTLPMRYDPADHSYVEIDCAQLRRRSAQRTAARDRAAIRDAEHRIAGHGSDDRPDRT